MAKSTWGQHADKDLLLFMSSAKEPSLPTVALNVTEGRDHLTSKTMKAFDYIYRHHFHKAEFFMKAGEPLLLLLQFNNLQASLLKGRVFH